MFEWLQINIGTIVVAIILIVLFFWVLIKIVKDCKNGKSSCDCNCERCAMSKKCNKNKDA
ncbi:MAG: FeoB-associated Cys-rich membrane protein [Clostridia bacterium]|nr:FeoB-associated Cys-rich membrane protein [Clostridia bacterium]